MILSFDVGQKNLAYCKVDQSQIVEWNVISLPTSGVCGVVQALKTHFPLDDEIDTVVVEKQPSRNIKMRIIETILLSYFATLGKKVVSYSAKHKLGSVGKEIKGKKNYTMRKKMSVVMCRTYLDAHESATNRALFEKSKKKDDLADCLLQFLAYTGFDTGSLCSRVIELDTD